MRSSLELVPIPLRCARAPVPRSGTARIESTPPRPTQVGSGGARRVAAHFSCATAFERVAKYVCVCLKLRDALGHGGCGAPARRSGRPSRRCSGRTPPAPHATLVRSPGAPRKPSCHRAWRARRWHPLGRLVVGEPRLHWRACSASGGQQRSFTLAVVADGRTGSARAVAARAVAHAWTGSRARGVRAGAVSGPTRGAAAGARRVARACASMREHGRWRQGGCGRAHWHPSERAQGTRAGAREGAGAKLDETSCVRDGA